MLEKESVKLRVAGVKTTEFFVQKVRKLSTGQLLQIVLYEVCTTTKAYSDLHAVPNLPTTKGKIKLKGAEHERESFMLQYVTLPGQTDTDLFTCKQSQQC